MSGIVAIVNFDGAPVDPETLRLMAEQCAYRGPDGIHYWIQGNVGMAHLALHSTPEALREHQPQLSQDGTLCLTADVRVDNRPELIELLISKGQPVSKDSTDADLLLAAYRIWGVECPIQIIGDYAFAVWDAREQRLFCARDVFGVKSLNYTRVGSTMCVASEAQQIIQHPKVPRIIDEVAMAEFLVGYIEEGRTMFQDVWAVKNAHSLVANSSGQHMQRYWDIDPKHRITYKSDEEYAAHFLEIFQRSVADHIRTQGKTIGITMSGGMDSTSIAAVAQRLLTSQPGQPHLLACSYAFDQLKECDETYYSRAMADELGIDLVYVPAENFWYLDNDEAFTPSLETPLMAEESITRYILGIFKGRGARVWLTGHGGDSLVGGSPFIYADHIRQGDMSPLWELARFWREGMYPFYALYYFYWEWLVKPLIPDLPRKLIRKLRSLQIPDWLNENFVRRTQIVERLANSYIPLHNSERAWQANYERAVHIIPIQRAVIHTELLGAEFYLETRHPFLDRRLAELIMAIPPTQTFRTGWGKIILRNAMRGILPEVVRTRPNKTEFSHYIALGLRFKESKKIQSFIESTLQKRLKLVYLSKLYKIYQRYILKGYYPDIATVWRFISLELWLRKYYNCMK
jgi:asparagine synthase (glutamine-hydrolysing)